MKTGTITLTTELTEGGCNACGPVRSEMYTLTLKDQDILLTGFTVSGIVMAVVQQAGWQQEFKVEIIDEYFLFSHDGAEVKLIEDYNEVTYESNGKRVNSQNEFESSADLFDTVNRVLTDLFGLAPIEFSLKMD